MSRAPVPGRLLADRRILVVGAGTRPSPDPDAPVGNGRAISVLAASEGAAVACLDVDEASARITADMVKAEGGRASVLVADVSDARVASSCVANASEVLGGWSRAQRGHRPGVPPLRDHGG